MIKRYYKFIATIAVICLVSLTINLHARNWRSIVLFARRQKCFAPTNATVIGTMTVKNGSILTLDKTEKYIITNEESKQRPVQQRNGTSVV